MPRRSRAREAAFQVLYQEDQNPPGDREFGEQLLRSRLQKDDLIEFARRLLAGVHRHQAEIDTLLGQTAANWSLHRMSPTDRNVLRLGAFEILHGDTPPRVAINEAVELAKRFGSAQSAQFVNGILDRLMHQETKDSPEPQ